VMAENATPAKIEATRGYGAEVVLHGTIWDEANEKALQLVEEQKLTYIHPFDDLELIAGQGTLGLEIYEDLPDVHTVVVPIGGGGLISGVSSALKSLNPRIRVVGVESSGAPAMQRSVAEGRRVQLEHVECEIDGLKVKRVGEKTLEIVSRMVDDIVTLPDEEIFAALLWTLARTKIVVEGAAAAPVGALLNGLVEAPEGSKVVAVLSGGNINLDKLRGLTWN
jgi:threonine dehydratase